MSKGQKRSNREAKKPKQPKAKVIAAAPSGYGVQLKSAATAPAGKK